MRYFHYAPFVSLYRIDHYFNIVKNVEKTLKNSAKTRDFERIF